MGSEKLDSLNLSDEIKGRIKEWLSPEYDEETRKEIEELIEKEDIKELEDRFFKELEFGTGGLRGVIGAGSNRMNIYNVRKATQGLSNYLKEYFKDRESISVAIAYDSRRMSDRFALETALVLAGNGIKAFLFDSLRPTPMLSFTVRYLKCQAGVVITASHNPPEYNGYKVYWEDGGQIVPPHDKNIISHVKKIKKISEVSIISKEEAMNKGLLEYIGEEVDKAYLDNVVSLSLNPDIVKEYGDKIKIVYTPLHGAGNIPVRKALERMGFKNIIVVKEQEQPDGNFPTVRYPNPEESEAMTLALKYAEEHDADILIGTDPDSDRMGVGIRDEQGKHFLINGNQAASLLTWYILSQLKEKNKLPENGMIVKTIVTTDLMKEIANDFGITTEETLTGFKYIGEKIRINEELKEAGKPYKQYIFGGEESYGYLAGTFVRDKDAVISTVLFSEMTAYLKSKGKSVAQQLDEIYQKYGYFKEELHSLTLKGVEGVERIKNIMEYFRNNPPEKIGDYKIIKIGDIKKKELFNVIENKVEATYDLPESNVIILFLEENTKITMRPSGTEPKIKFYFASFEKNIDNLNEVKRKVDNRVKEVVKKFFEIVENVK